MLESNHADANAQWSARASTILGTQETIAACRFIGFSERLAAMDGLLYCALLVALTGTVLRRDDFQRLATPAYAIAAVVLIGISYLSGWTNLDLSFFAIWGRTLLAHGFAHLYELTPINYPPGYPAILAIPAMLERLLPADAHRDVAAFLFKLPPVLAQLLLPVIVGAAITCAGVNVAGWRITALIAATLLNPGLLVISAIWGQSDVLLSDLLLLSAIALARKHDIAAGALLTAALLMKLQAAVVAPAVLALVLVSRRVRLLIGVVIALLTALPATLPHGGIALGFVWLASLYRDIGNSFGAVTIFAGTLPALLSGNEAITDDVSMGVGLSFFAFSIVCESLLAFALVFAVWRERQRLTNAFLFYVFAVSQVGVYYFATRMHERYLTYGVIATIAWAFIARNRFASISATVLSAALLLQLLAGLYIDRLLGIHVGASLVAVLSYRGIAEIYCALTLLGVVYLVLSRWSPADAGTVRSSMQTVHES